MQIPILNLGRLHEPIYPVFEAQSAQLFKRGDYIKGAAVSMFETALSQYLKVPYVVSCGNGTDALLIAYLALGLKAGDTIIMPAFNYISAVETAVLLGLRVVYADVELDTFNIDLKSLERMCDHYLPKAILTVSLFGLPVDRINIKKIAEKYGAFVIEDQAQSIGAKIIDEKSAEHMHWSDVSTTSFFPTKNLGGIGDGGALYTEREDLYFKIKAIANHGQYKKYMHTMVGVNSRLDSIQAIFLSEKLKKLSEHNAKRKEIAAKYSESLKDSKSIKSPLNQTKKEHIYHQYTLRVLHGKRLALQQNLAEKGIQTMIYYPMPLYKQEAYCHTFMQNEPCEHSEQLCEEVLSLPICPTLTEQEIQYIIHSIQTFDRSKEV